MKENTTPLMEPVSTPPSTPTHEETGISDNDFIMPIGNELEEEELSDIEE